MPAKSKSQQRFMGMVHAYQKGELKDAPQSVKKAAGSMTKKASKDFAKTKHKGLPEKVTEELDLTGDEPIEVLRQELAELEGEHERATMAGDEEIMDQIEQDMFELEELIARKLEAQGNVNVAEAFKSLTFRTFLKLDEVEDQGAAELQLRTMIMQLAQLVAKELGAQQQQTPTQTVQQKQQQPRKQQRSKGSQAQALKQQKIQQSLRQANQLGRKVQTEGVLDKAKQVGALRAGLGTLGQTFGMLGQGVRKRTQELGAASPVGKFLRGAAERYAEKLAGKLPPDTKVAPAATTTAAATPATQPQTVPAAQGKELQAARGRARKPQPAPQPTPTTPAAQTAASRAARAAQMQGAAQTTAATPIAQLTQNITQGLQGLSTERRTAVINTAIEGLTAGKRNTPQNVAVANKVREILLKSLQGQGA